MMFAIVLRSARVTFSIVKDIFGVFLFYIDMADLIYIECLLKWQPTAVNDKCWDLKYSTLPGRRISALTLYEGV